MWSLVWTVLRHLLALVVLPVTMTVFIPIWVARRYGVAATIPQTVGEGLLLLPGVGFLAAGLALFAASLYQFATRGRGTLGFWDPPHHLVVRGPYRFVRNPMISGVIFVLVGEAFLLRSLPHATWAAAFTALNFTYIPLLEEPELEERFGDEYRRYKRYVPRFIPRLRPWTGGEDGDPGAAPRSSR